MPLNLYATLNVGLNSPIELKWTSTDNRELRLKDFCRIKLPKCSAAKNADTLISGRAPLWIYMYSALMLKESGAKTISIYQPQAGNTKISPVESHADKAPIGSPPEITPREKFYLLQYSPHPPYSPEQLPSFRDNLPGPPTAQATIIFSGKLCNWVASFLALSAREKGWNSIAYFSPKNGKTLQIFPKLKWLNIGTPLAKNGKVIGVVGDPNSGKSVFSGLLYQAGYSAKERIWLYDCDYSAPTPPWYLETLKSKSREFADKLRKAIKKPWESGAEATVVANVKKVRRHLDWLIADLPGGNFSLNPPQRIPCGREILMEGIDYFIILARKTAKADTGTSWREELAKHGLEKRILLTIFSESPQEPPRLWQSHDGYWHISGLQREHSENFPPELQQRLWHLVTTNINSRSR